VISAVLAATGYIANAIGAEPQATVTGITLVRFLCPLVMAAIMVITLHFYPITEETKKNFAGLYDNKNEERG
jgi:Na+/melibiose symporter-like transporter